MDDEYNDKAAALKKKYTNFFEGLWDLAEGTGKFVADLVVGLLKGLFIDIGWGLIKLVYNAGIIAVSAKIPDIIEPKFLKDAANERIDSFYTMVQQIVEDPFSVVEGMGQSISDSVEEDGIVYVTGGVAAGFVPIVGWSKYAKIGKVIDTDKPKKSVDKTANNEGEMVDDVELLDERREVEPEVKGGGSPNDVINTINKTDNVDEAVEIVKSTEISKWVDTDVYELLAVTYKKVDWSEANIAKLQRTVAEESGWIGKYYDKDMNIIWPGMNGDPNIDGFVNGVSNPALLQVGTRIDRYGHPGGAYLSPEGISYGARELRPGTKETSNYFVYEVIKPIEVNSGTIAPWFGQPGGGIQYHLGKGKSVQQLIEENYLMEIREVID